MVVDVADGIVEQEWPQEEIPDEDILYMRVHRQQIRADGSFRPGAWQNHGEGMSTNWSRYSTPETTRNEVLDLNRIDGRNRRPEDNAVVRMIVRDVREIPGQTVVHTPIPSNRAHTDVRGEKDAEARVKFGRIYEVVLPLPA